MYLLFTSIFSCSYVCTISMHSISQILSILNLSTCEKIDVVIKFIRKIFNSSNNSCFFIEFEKFDIEFINISIFAFKQIDVLSIDLFVFFCWKDNLLNDKCARDHLIEIDEKRTNAFSLRLASRHHAQNRFRFVLYLETHAIYAIIAHVLNLVLNRLWVRV